jgi:acetylornithine deacetylase
VTQGVSTALARSLDASVDELESFCLELLREMVRTPSITGNETAAQLRLAGRLREHNLEVDSWCPTTAEVSHHLAFSDDGLPLGDRPVVVARWRGSDPSAPSLILNGHMDVVPTGDERAWTGGPFSGDIRDDRLWGRGACDMKGGLAAAVTAVAALQRCGLRLRGDVLIQSVIGEETGGVGTLAALLRGYRADAAIILEPTRMALCPIGAGALSFRLHIQGRAAHGAMRTEGVSAVTKFYRAAEALEQLEGRRHSGFHHPFFQSGELIAPISIGKIHAGDWPSTVPESLIAEGRFGVLPGEDIESARRQFEAAIRHLEAADEWFATHPVEVEWFEGQFEPGETPADAAILRALSTDHRAICSREARIHGVPYGSDLRLFTRHGGMHAVLYGPGDVRVAHSLNEFVPLDELRRVSKVVARTIARWCGVAG